MFGKKKETNKKTDAKSKTVAKKLAAVKQRSIGSKKKTIELTELEAEKVQACISLRALQDDIRATQLDRKERLTKKELNELDSCRERSSFYNALAKKFK